MRSMARIPETEKNIRMTTAFGGYNHREIIQDGECFDMQNMSADLYPAMGTRRKRGITESEETLNGIAGRSELVLVKGQEVFYGGMATGLMVSDGEDMLPKQIVSLGAYVCIWPDKKYVNTHDFTDQGEMERYWYDGDHAIWPSGEIPGSPVEGAPIIQLCDGDGTDYDMTTITTAKTAPKNPADGKLWIDQSGDSDVLRQWSSDRKEWTEVPTVYLKISAPEIGKGLKQYDGVVIKNLKYEPYWENAYTITNRVKKQLEALNGSTIIYFCGNDYIVIAGMLSRMVNLYTTLQVNREVPKLDYMCESNNRIWGCKYGPDVKKEIIFHCAGGIVQIAPSSSTGTTLTDEDMTVADSAPDNPQNGDLWMDTSGETDVLKKYRTSSGTWIEEQAYVKLFTPTIGYDIGANISTNEYVDISGLMAVRYLDNPEPNDKVKKQVRDMNGHHQVIWRDDKTIVIKGIVEFRVQSGHSITGDENVKIEKANTDEGTFYNEVRACALGDFKNWNKYMGLSTDSYAASVGTDGPFTGAAAQAGYPVFFKENCIHKLYGAAPNSFQITTIMCRGVQQGSGRSVAVVNETILYKGLSDVMYFDGNMPQSIGENLGDVYYEDARAGAVNGKYYISMRHGDAWSLFVYDTKKGIWTREDDIRAMGFATVGDELYMIDEENNTLVTVNGTAGTQESGPIEWTAVFGISGIEYIQGGRADMHKYLYMSRFDMRLAMDEDAEAELWIEYDSDGIWIQKGRIKRNRMGMIVLPVVPRRCDHLRAKITGRGGFRILSLSKVLEVGSDG